MGLSCKVRHFLALVLSVAITSFVLSLYSQKQPRAFQDIVTQTHRQLESIKEGIQAGVSSPRDKQLEVDDKYLSLLGFVRDPEGKESTQAQRLGLTDALLTVRSRKGTVGPNGSEGDRVTIVTAVHHEQLSKYEDFLSNVQAALPSYPIFVWNIDAETPIEEDDGFSVNLKQSCNSSLCYVKRFGFEEYPDHVRDLGLGAYRPLILQIMLDAATNDGCSLWLDIDRRFLAQPKVNLNQFLELAKTGGSNGLVGWPSGHPTSTLTHPKMFSFFDTTAENYYFHRMIDPSQLLLCKSEELLSKVMKPWVACSLKKDCIAPFGAQSGGCRFDKKPMYRYSGCHAYDAAALNVALGVAFPMHQPYISRAPLTKPVQLMLANATAFSR